MDYINFLCGEYCTHQDCTFFSPNNKPWITLDIKALLREEQRAFKSGDREKLKATQKELGKVIRSGKNSYRMKMENQLQQNSVSGVWRSLRTISGHKELNQQPVGDLKWANDLNNFFNRFDLSGKGKIKMLS